MVSRGLELGCETDIVEFDKKPQDNVEHTQFVHDIVANYLISTSLARVLKSRDVQEWVSPTHIEGFEEYMYNKMGEYYELSAKHKKIAYNMLNFLSINRGKIPQLEGELLILAKEVGTISPYEIYKKRGTLQEKWKSPDNRERSYLFVD